jgi:hypothetical protein
MRQSGITVTAITNIHEVGKSNQSDAKKPASSEPKSAKREVQRASANETEVKKEKKATNRRARKKS